MVEVIKLNNLCNDLGLDTSSRGHSHSLGCGTLPTRHHRRSRDGRPAPLGRCRSGWEPTGRHRSSTRFWECARRIHPGSALGSPPRMHATTSLAGKTCRSRIRTTPLHQELRFGCGGLVPWRRSPAQPAYPGYSGSPRSCRQRCTGADTSADPTAYETKEVVVEFRGDIVRGLRLPSAFVVSCVTGGIAPSCWVTGISQNAQPGLGFRVEDSELREAGRWVVDLERLLNARFGLTARTTRYPPLFRRPSVERIHTGAHDRSGGVRPPAHPLLLSARMGCGGETVQGTHG